MFSDAKDEITPAVALGGHLSALRLESRSVAFSRSAPLHLGGAIAIRFLAAEVVRDALLPICKVTDLVPEGAVSLSSFKRQ